MFIVPTIEEKYEIPRYDGWEEVLEPLIRKIINVEQSMIREGVDYENDIFMLKTQRYGICHCSYGQKYREFLETHKHSDDCFQTIYQEIQDAFRNHPHYNKSLKLKQERVKMERELYKEFGIPYSKKSNSNVFCSCTFRNDWERLNSSHDANCSFLAPNFHYKESDLKIWWNVRFFKDSYANQLVTLDEFKKIIGVCIRSAPRQAI